MSNCPNCGSYNFGNAGNFVRNGIWEETIQQQGQTADGQYVQYPRTVTRKSKEAEILTRDEPRMGMGMNCLTIVCWIQFILPLLLLAVFFFISAISVGNGGSARLQLLLLGVACVVGVIVVYRIMKAVRNSSNKYIIPVLHRPCTIRADLKILQIISFLAPKPYEAAFQEVLGALGLPPETPVVHKVTADQTSGAATTWLRQIEAAFAAQDWPDVIRKGDYLIKRFPDSATATVYRFHGLAYLEEGEEQHAQEALETALVLVSDRELRLTLLSDYTALLARQNQWAKVLKRVREALRLVPNDPGWLVTQQQAQNELAQQAPVPSLSHEQTSSTDQKPAPTPQKTKEQWLEEGNALDDLKRYEEALAAYEQALRLDPNFAFAYYNKGVTLERLGRKREAQQAYERARQHGYNA